MPVHVFLLNGDESKTVKFSSQAKIFDRILSNEEEESKRKYKVNFQETKLLFLANVILL